MPDVDSMLAPFLATPKVEHRRAEAGGLDDAAGTIPHKDRREMHQAEEYRAGKIAVKDDPG